MLGRCPYLGLDGNRRQVFLVSSSLHRCHVRDGPERIAGSYQSEACLTTGYRRCPRLVGQRTDAVPQASGWDPQARTKSGDRAESPDRVRKLGIYADLTPSGPAPRGRSRLSLGLIELVVVGLGVSIVLAVLFIGYALVHRLRVGPGMETVPQLAGASQTVSDVVGPTLAATLGPTALPTATIVDATVGPPTPIPEPTLPMPTAYTRLPATSPPTRLRIPKIDLDIAVIPVGSKTIADAGGTKTVWADVPNAGGFHRTSAYPGNPGNTVINGHRDILGAVFRHLDRLARGDEITLYVDQATYPYLVTDILVVPETFASAAQRAENLRLIGYMPEERLTLVTCTPVGLATHRLLVIARPPEQAMPQMPEAGTGTRP